MAILLSDPVMYQMQGHVVYILVFWSQMLPQRRNTTGECHRMKVTTHHKKRNLPSLYLFCIVMKYMSDCSYDA